MKPPFFSLAFEFDSPMTRPDAGKQTVGHVAHFRLKEADVDLDLLTLIRSHPFLSLIAIFLLYDTFIRKWPCD